MKLADITKPAVTVHESVTFREVVEKMITEQTNSVLVVDDAGVLVGEISVSDLMDAIVPAYLDGDSIAAHFATEEMFAEAIQDARDMPAKDFMNTNVVSIKATDGLMSVAATAIAEGKARIPVVDDTNMPVGMVSRRGLKHLIAHYLDIKDSGTDS
jgi:CBS domain-containing protein